MRLEEEFIPSKIKKALGKEEWFEYDDFIVSKADGIFRTGQPYEEKPAETLSCKLCGSNKFFVGSGDYWTGLKCEECEWEYCIHEG